ncbi:hypothetical protein MAR_021082 [Mya arenaria]|uniref:DUF6570 domain-containing protein n=1 Tax=Mya arenaria TaxID=6604 RepID=A0ABY7E6V3_MYAAR|nr:hypothetical protein MAR_021082 [Mya arenaria]
MQPYKNQFKAAPPLTGNIQYDKALDCIRAFEVEQMSYTFLHELYVKKQESKQYGSFYLPKEIKELSFVEQLLIGRVLPCMNVFMLKHGGIASSGHCVSFPQEVDEPGNILPRLPHEIDIIKVRKHGQNESYKHFKVSRSKVLNALVWLMANNPAFHDIIISEERLQLLLENGELSDIEETEVNKNFVNIDDQGPAPGQLNVSLEEKYFSTSGVLLADTSTNIAEKLKCVIEDVLGHEHASNIQKDRHGLFFHSMANKRQ